MTIKQLLYFTKTCECGNMLGAAELLYISQQALSRSLSTLEQELGVVLLLRSHKGVEPTAIGEELYHRALPILKEMDQLKRHMEDLSRINSGQLRIGLAAGTRYLNSRRIWREFQNQNSGVSIQSKEYPYLSGLDQLKYDQLDLLTFSDYDAGEEYVQYELRTWNRAFLVPKGHPRSNEPYAKPEFFKDENLVFCANPMVHQRFLQYCSAHDCMPADIVLVSDTLYMYENCQRESCLGITIQKYFSEHFLPQFPDLKTLPFQEEFLPYTVSAIFKRNHPQAGTLHKLSEFLKASLQQL